MVRVVEPSGESESTVLNEEQVELAERYRDALREIAELEDHRDTPLEEDVETAERYLRALKEAAHLES